MKQPNILLLMCDQFRGDCLSYAGHPDVKTPYLDTLASDGAFFDRAYSSCPSCIPARAALFTGKSQEHHGRVGYEDGIDWNRRVQYTRIPDTVCWKDACTSGEKTLRVPRTASARWLSWILPGCLHSAFSAPDGD